MTRSPVHKKATDAHGRRSPCTAAPVHIGPGLCLRAVLALLACTGLATGSIPSATVPPSSYQSGLIATPNPIDHSANLPITGNVLGGKHFRAPIPYNSTTAFGAPLGSTRLDSFLRYSGQTQSQPGYPQSYSPFYSSTGTVTTIAPGYQGAFAPGSPRIAGGSFSMPADQRADVTAMAGFPEARISIGDRGAADPGMGTSLPLPYRPTSESLQDTRELASYEPDDPLAWRLPTQPGDRLMTPDEVQRRLEQLRRDVERIEADASQLGRTSDAEEAVKLEQPTLRRLPPAEPGQEESPPLPDGGLMTGLKTFPPTSPRLELYDPSAARRQALADPLTSLGQIDTPTPTEVQPDTVASGRLPAWERIEETSRALDVSSRFLSRTASDPTGVSNRHPTTARPRNAAAIDSPAQGIPLPEPGDVQPASEQAPVAGPVPRTYENAGSISRKQFDDYLTVADRFMQQERYDRAANAFALALAYIPHDPRAHLGKSHALLAIGDYAGSAASLARAVELDARRALERVDLVETIGGPDRFVQRITELEDRAENAGPPEFQLLLAYVYHQMDLPERARTAIETARTGLPSSPAVRGLAAAIGR